MAMDATSGAAIIFFVMLVLMGTFVLVNLFVSVVTGVLGLEEARAAKEKTVEPQVSVIALSSESRL